MIINQIPRIPLVNSSHIFPINKHFPINHRNTGRGIVKYTGIHLDSYQIHDKLSFFQVLPKLPSSVPTGSCLIYPTGVWSPHFQCYALVNWQNYGNFMGKLTISMAIFHGKLFNYLMRPQTRQALWWSGAMGSLRRSPGSGGVPVLFFLRTSMGKVSMEKHRGIQLENMENYGKLWKNNWLLVWNIFYFSIYWEQSSQLTFIFFRGVDKPPTR